ncbi:hypothetical protein FHN55_07000 [Streptomyces sp. NP160]|uniref:hypothetical protein n=1 Tax=Streptomyces sp. NP160 TaxID=2586637 RepID=UPI001117B3F4|nr:hypothetical protein [Streptomyces sp. NP160]TNM68537.1 hypothetical protein FHN55_07000 [Streptomyces sp. NP160]
MSGLMDHQFGVTSFDLRVPTTGGFRGTAVPASARTGADGPGKGALVGLLGGERLGAGYGHALRQRPDAVGSALISNPPVSGLLPVRRQVLTS